MHHCCALHWSIQMSKNKAVEDTRHLHKLSSYNRTHLTNASYAGCFFCLEIFPTHLIKEMIDKGETALCPFCEIDAVLPDCAELHVNLALLQRMQKIWFNGVFDNA